MPFDHSGTRALAVGDVDRDGDADIVFAEGLAETLYVNLHKHLSAPSFAMLSRELEVELHAKPGYGAFAHTGVVFLGLGLAPAPIALPPLGTFFLNPSPLVALPRVTIRPPARTAGFSIPIPAVPRLLGFELYLQALIANEAHVVDQHLTGYTVDTIRR